jgi:hypothetical protein
MQSLWSRTRTDAKADAAPTSAGAQPEPGSSATAPGTDADVDVDADLLVVPRPKSRSFSGGNMSMVAAAAAAAAAVTVAAGERTTGFLSKLTPLLPSQLMKGGSGARSAAADTPSFGTDNDAGSGRAVPVPAAPAVASAATASSKHRRKGRRRVRPPRADATTEAPLGSAPILSPGGTWPTAQDGGPNPFHPARQGDGDDHVDSEEEGEDDGEDGESDGGGAASDASWDGLDDVYTSPSSGPSAIGGIRRRSNSDAGSVHSALSVTNLVGKYVGRLWRSHGTSAHMRALPDADFAPRYRGLARSCDSPMSTAYGTRWRQAPPLVMLLRLTGTMAWMVGSVRRGAQLVKVLPRRLCLSDWHLIYSTYVHGITLSTLYTKVQQLSDPGESILVVRDNAGHVRGPLPPTREPAVGLMCVHTHGCRCLVALRHSRGGRSPFTMVAAKCFCSGCCPCGKSLAGAARTTTSSLGTTTAWPSAAGGCGARRTRPCGRPCATDPPRARVRASGSYGLWMDQQLYHASSARCETFENDVLAHKEDFLIMGLELWGFTPGA